jgi:hypothetical protein
MKSPRADKPAISHQVGTAESNGWLQALLPEYCTNRLQISQIGPASNDMPAVRNPPQHIRRNRTLNGAKPLGNVSQLHPASGSGGQGGPDDDALPDGRLTAVEGGREGAEAGRQDHSNCHYGDTCKC